MLRIFKRLTKNEVLLGLLSLIFIVLQVWLDLKLPDYMSEITMLVQTETGDIKGILFTGGMMLLSALGSLISAVVVAVLASKISMNFGANLREKLFDKVQSFSLEEISSFSTASLITRSTNDITQVQTLIVMGLQVIVKAPILAAWAIVRISGKSWQWTFSTAAAILIILVIVSISILLALPKFKKLQVLTDNLNNVTRENLIGLQVVRAYNAENYQENKFESVNTELTKAHLFTGRVMAFLMPNIQLVTSGLTLAIYWMGAILIQNAHAVNKLNLFSDMVVFSTYAMQIIMSFMMLITIFVMVPRASVSAKRILEVLDTQPTIVDGAITESDTNKVGTVEFKNVSFKYPGSEEYVLEDINFTVNQGETVAIIGATGSGKSTLVNLIPRFFEASEGEVLVDGLNVKDYTKNTLHNKIGYVPQKAMLFSGTVKSNIAYGENGKGDFSERAVVEAVHTAQATDFVENLEDNYDGFIAQSGANLSGGQKQRLSIARAIARQPELLIFDDSFSALDYQTDQKLRESLEKDCSETTKLIVAQRIGTIQDADFIIVLDNGRISSVGTHDELMETSDVYQEIAHSQLSKEELA